MSVVIRQIGLCFAGEVENIDITKPIAAEEI